MNEGGNMPKINKENLKGGVSKKSKARSTTPKKKKNAEKQKIDSSQFLQFKGFLSFLILHELSKEKLCGEELAERIGKRKGSKLTPGAIYPTLKRLRKLKLVAYRRKGRKKYYMLTELGNAVLQDLYIKFSRYFFGLKKYIRRY